MENNANLSQSITKIYKCSQNYRNIKILMTYSLIRLARPLKMSTLRQPMLLLDKSL